MRDGPATDACLGSRAGQRKRICRIFSCLLRTFGIVDIRAMSDERATSPGIRRGRRTAASRGRGLLAIFLTFVAAGQVYATVPAGTMQCYEVKPGAFSRAPL